MNLTLPQFFEKHKHLKVTHVAEAAGVPYQRLTEISAGKRAMTQELADRLNAAIETMTNRQQRDKIKC